MSSVLTSNKLIASIKRRAMIPNNQDTFTDEDFLEMLNEEIQYFGVPQLLRTHEEYLLNSIDVPLDGRQRYEIPYRAVGNKLRELSYVTNVSGVNGSNTGEQIYELSRISVEDLPDYNNFSTTRYSQAFYVENNKITLLGEVPVSDTVLRMHFYMRPNTFVLNNRAGVIQSLDLDAGVIVLENFPTAFSTEPLMDFIKHQSPNVIMAFDVQPLSVDSTSRTLTFDPDKLPSNLQVGDYVNVAQETIVPQLPVELHAILAQRVAVAALEALGDQEGLVSAQRRLDMMEMSSNDIIDNRVEGAPQKINNRHSPLRDAVISRRGIGRKGRV
jgi:hypothetical protein